MNTHEQRPCWGVYRILASGEHEYVPHTATTNEKLAIETASDLSIGRVVRPDGSILWVPAHPHISKLIPDRIIAAGNAPENNTPAHLATDVVPLGWSEIEAGSESFAPSDGVIVTLTRGEIAALVKACSIADDEGQLDEPDGRSAWLKLVNSGE